MRRAKLSFGCLMAIPLIAELAGCSEDELRLRDLRVVAVERISSSDHGIPDDARKLGKDDTGVLKLVLSTDRDLRKIVDKHSLNLSVHTYFCADPSAEALALVYVYDSSGVPILPGYKSAHGVEGKMMTSYVALAAPERTTVDRAATLPAYDLKASPDDLCLQLRGGKMIGRHLRSNVARLDAESLRAALEQ